MFSQAKQTKETPTVPPAVPPQCQSACHFQWLFLLLVCNYPGMPFPTLLRQPGFKAPQRAVAWSPNPPKFTASIVLINHLLSDGELEQPQSKLQYGREAFPVPPSPV